jgi:hypothetical protein
MGEVEDFIRSELEDRFLEAIQAEMYRLDHECATAVMYTDYDYLQQLIIVVYPDDSRYVACLLEPRSKDAAIWTGYLLREI